MRTQGPPCLRSEMLDDATEHSKPLCRSMFPASTFVECISFQVHMGASSEYIVPSLGLMRMMNVPLQVDGEAFSLLPSDLQAFVSRLSCEAAVINGFLWDQIILTGGVPQIRLGSPAQRSVLSGAHQEIHITFGFTTTKRANMRCIPFPCARHHGRHLKKWRG